ncbi:hypothetical protein F2Q70_00006082 [Brassica cretica]|uniref:Uncharacterized protein n=1 Tax=Brassica cretica TaxID=69181 RepID=A0A8S9FTJ1_BRACR|nr:hypothetical protein F2Q68_00022711 [Brassica cretica]KAF2575147.1 hypothetical protein F2Q70_00006082 [Brassica cretica]
MRGSTHASYFVDELFSMPLLNPSRSLLQRLYRFHLQATSVLLSYPQTYKVNPHSLAAPHGDDEHFVHARYYAPKLGRYSKAEIPPWSFDDVLK